MSLSRLHKTFVVALAFTLAMVGFTTTAQGTAIYDAYAEGSLEIQAVVIGDVTISTGVTLYPLYKDSGGDASADAEGVATPSPSSVYQDSDSSGTATNGWAKSEARMEGWIEIENLSSSEAEVVYQFYHYVKVFTQLNSPHHPSDSSDAHGSVIMSKQVGDGEIQKWISYAVHSHVDYSDLPPGYDWPAPSTDTEYGLMDIPAGETVKLFCEARAWGEAYGGEQPPEEQIAEILDFFDNSVAGGGLVGTGRGNSAEKRLNALRNMIEAAGDLISDGRLEDACQQLMDVYKKTDGQLPPESPPDFVAGEAAEELATLIQDLMTSLGCGSLAAPPRTRTASAIRKLAMTWGKLKAR